MKLFSPRSPSSRRRRVKACYPTADGERKGFCAGAGRSPPGRPGAALAPGRAAGGFGGVAADPRQVLRHSRGVSGRSRGVRPRPRRLFRGASSVFRRPLGVLRHPLDVFRGSLGVLRDRLGGLRGPLGRPICLLKKGTGTSRDRVLGVPARVVLGASPLFQRTPMRPAGRYLHRLEAGATHLAGETPTPPAGAEPGPHSLLASPPRCLPCG